MATNKLTRITQKIFASEAPADQLVEFGTAKTGTPVISSDVETLQSNPAYTQGYQDAVLSDYAPFLPETNSLHYIETRQLAYLFQHGLAEWDANTVYYKDVSFCSYKGDIYKCLTDDNIGLEPNIYPQNWKVYAGGSGGGLEICDIGMALYVDETKGKRRYLNGQIVAINENTKAFLDKLLQIKAIHPNLFTTEDNWQAEKSLSAFGQVGKFVLNLSGDNSTVESVRLPAVVNVQGLFDLQNLGMTVQAGLPNIIGQFTNNGHSGYSNASGAFKTIPGGVGSSEGGKTDGGWFTFDASRSNSIYGRSATVQQEAIQYPYFIQIATGSETENNIVNDIELNNPYTLLDSKYSSAPLYNLSWLKADGNFQPKTVYPKVYEALAVEYNAEIEAGASTELPSGTRYVKRGLAVKLASDADISDYDFVINTTDETFRLPLKNYSADDATTGLSLYFYVGETVQNANLIDAGRITEAMALKTDKAQAAHAVMPSTKHISITPPASASTGSSLSNTKLFVAPVDCWVDVCVTINNGSGVAWIGGNSVARSNRMVGSANCANFNSLPMKKGETLTLRGSHVSQINEIRYSPCVGTESEVE